VSLHVPRKEHFYQVSLKQDAWSKDRQLLFKEAYIEKGQRERENTQE
jgi:hypothetical protein